MPGLSQRQTAHHMSDTLSRIRINAQQQMRQAAFQLHGQYLRQSFDDIIRIVTIGRNQELVGAELGRSVQIDRIGGLSR
jgi:hypothetical protein